MVQIFMQSDLEVMIFCSEMNMKHLLKFIHPIKLQLNVISKSLWRPIS
jgi:hypothetical protein